MEQAEQRREKDRAEEAGNRTVRNHGQGGVLGVGMGVRGAVHVHRTEIGSMCASRYAASLTMAHGAHQRSEHDAEVQDPGNPRSLLLGLSHADGSGEGMGKQVRGF
jgi:hypothetical protein